MCIVTASYQRMPVPSWLHPVPAGMLSLAAVSSFTLLLGAVFLPAEALRLYPSRHISVTHVLPHNQHRAGVVLFWSIAEQGAPGWRHHLSVGGIERPLLSDDRRPLEPLTIAAVPGANQSIVGNWDGSLYLLDHRTPDKPPRLLGRQPDGGVVDVACSPDGRLAVSMNAFTLYAWDVAKRRELWRHNDIQPSCLAYGPLGATVFVGDCRGEFSQFDARTGEVMRVRPPLDSPAVAMALSPDEEQLAILAADGQLHLLDSKSLAINWSTTSGWHLSAGRFVAFSPRGDVLVTTDATNPRALTLLDVHGKKQRASLMGHEGLVLGAAFTDDGGLITWGADGSVLTWDLGRQKPVTMTRYGPQEKSTS